MRRLLTSFVHLGGGTALSQVVVLATTPLMSRLYSAAAIGLFTLYFTYVNFAQSGSSLMYSAAIPTAESDREAMALLRLSLWLNIPYSLLGGGAFLVLQHWDLLGFGHFPAAAAGLAMVSTALAGSFVTFRFFLVRSRQYSSIARAVILQNSTRGVGQVVGGFLSPLWWMLTLWDVVGRIFGSAPGVRLALRSPVKPERGEHAAVARRFKAFPLVYLPSTLIDNLVVWLPLPLITAQYGLTAAGFFGMVTRLAALPISVIATSIADVFHGDLAEHRRLRQDPRRLFWRTTGVLVAIGFPIAIAIALLGKFALTLYLGPQWGPAGDLALLMAPWFFAQFVVNPLSRAVLVFEAQQWKLIYDGVALVSILVVYVTATSGGHDLGGFVLLLSSVSAFTYVLYFLIIHRIVLREASRPCAESLP